MNTLSFINSLKSLAAKRDTSYSFSRLGPDGQVIPLPGGSPKSPNVLLIAPKSMSIRPFDLPTSSKAQIRKILAATLLPYDIHNDLATFPCIIHKAQNSRNSQGIAFCTTSDSLPDSGSAFRSWPAPLILAGGLSSGSGVTIWQDETGFFSMLWENWVPTIVRYNAGSDIDSVINWYNDWNSRHNLPAPEVYSYSALTPDLFGDLQENAAITLANCEWLASLDMSHKAVQSSIILEQNINSLTKCLAWACVILVIMLGARGLSLYSEQAKAEALTSRMSDYYRQTFEPDRRGNISNPVALAREFIGAPTEQQEPHPFGEVLADLGDVLSPSNGLNVTIDTVRYNSAGLDITGNAPDMTTVLNFRSQWEKLGARAQADNTQYVSGIGYRFDVRVRWE